MARRRTEQKRRRRARTWLLAGAGAIAVLGTAAFGANAYYNNLKDTFNTAPVNKHFSSFQFKHRITILLMGSSLVTNGNNQVVMSRHAQDRTDTMMLVSINPTTHQVGVISIPRDTRVNIPGVGETKIAEASFVGGVKESVKVVEQNFHVPVDYYAYISMAQFAKVINDMGGLTMYIPQNEVYQPSGGKLGINLKKGWHHLSGWQVLEYARYRNTAQGDIGRIQQQQQILRDIAKQLLQPKYLPLIPKLASDLSAALAYSNLSTNQILSLALFSRHISMSSVRFGTVPGHSSTHQDPLMHQALSYWTYDPHLASVLVQDVLLGAPLTSTQKASLKFYVDSGTSSLAPAQALAKKLQQDGFTVTGVGWANSHTHKRSVIVNTTGDRFLGQRIASLVGPNVNNFAPYHTTPWDIKITVGSDYSAK